MRTLDDLRPLLMSGDVVKPTALFIGLNGGSLLTGHMNGELMVNDLMGGALKIIKSEITRRWKELGTPQRARKVEQWFKPNKDTINPQAWNALVRLVRARLVRWLVVADPFHHLETTLVTCGALDPYRVIKLTDYNVTAIAQRLQFNGPATTFVDAAEMLFSDVPVGRDGSKFNEQSRQHLLRALQQQCELFLVWGWSDYNSTLDRFLDEDGETRRLCLLGRDSQNNALGAAWDVEVYGEPYASKPDDSLMPSSAVLAAFANRFGTRVATPPTTGVAGDGKDDFDGDDQPNTPIAARRIANVSDAATHDYWLCHDDLRGEMDDDRQRALVIAGIDGAMVRTFLTMKLRDEWAEEGVVALVWTGDLSAAGGPLLRMLERRAAPRRALVLCSTIADDHVMTQAAALLGIARKAGAAYERLVVVAPSQFVRDFQRVLSTTSDANRPLMQPMYVWRTAEESFASASFRRVFSRSRLRLRPADSPKSLSLAPRLSMYALDAIQGRRTINAVDTLVDRAQSALNIVMDVVRAADDAEQTTEDQFFQLWADLVGAAPPTEDFTVGAVKRAQSPFPSDGAPMDPQGPQVEPGPEAPIVTRRRPGPPTSPSDS